MKIALCAGHHPGAPGAGNKRYGLTEHDEALKVIKYLYPALVAAGHEVVVINGHLSYKIRMINAGGFDLALDLHFNADDDHLDPDDLDNSRGSGCMVMYCPKAPHYGDREPYHERREQADTFSSAMNFYMDSWTRDLGGRAGWWWGSVDEAGNPTKKDAFLSQTNCPAFIPEPGYLDNNAFAEKWLVPGRHDHLAQAILFAIQEVF